MSEPKELRKEIGKVLKSWLEAHDISQAQVARDLDVSPAYVSGLCSGKTIGKRMAKKLADLYGLSEAFLLTGRGLIDGGIVSSEEKPQVFQRAIQKSKRLVETLDYLISEGIFTDRMSAAAPLSVTNAVLQKAMKYDPEGQIDDIMVKLHTLYNISLSWLLTGKGQMVESSAMSAAYTFPTGAIDALLKDNEELKTSIAQLQQESDARYAALMRELIGRASSYGIIAADDVIESKDGDI